ncbi:MAG: ATP-binding protein [Syntrophaceae bacterium]|nr:ATP-binding protein [Syntrophaceae bacterium]
MDDEVCKANAGVEPGDHVLLEITDTGRGMDEKTLSRIYDPFFSTKQRGSTRGTGLGLSVVKGILSKHNSLITCESAPGKGTTFRIYFKDAAANDVGCSNRSTSPPSGARAKSTLIVP